jgi:HD-GYP domain-containing protein (c-di-GMP phosphodiesterase class II)
VQSLRWRAGLAALVLGPVALLVGLRTFPDLDLQQTSAYFHLAVVGTIAGAALLVAVWAARTAVATEQPGPVYLALGCIGLGVFMLGHGLTTPGVLGQPFNPWVARLPYFALLTFAGGLLLAGRRAGATLNRWVTAHSAVALAVPGTVAVVATALLVWSPTLLSHRPAFEEPALAVVSIVVCLVALRSAWIHWGRWHLGRDEIQLSLVIASSMTFAAAMSLELGQRFHLSWWDYHAYLLTAFTCAVYVVQRRHQRSARVTDVLDAAFVEDPIAHIVRGYPEALKRLVKAVERKDAYTHGHSQRTARVATLLGIRMRLSPDHLRVIARGAYLHDIGKITIPDEILNKPGALDERERAIIETHPVRGFELASSAPALAEALPVILHHHERYDGSGYPEGLVGDDIPLAARVVTVADVWDALTTDRAYRPGWPPSRALAHLVAGRGTHFDPAVVDAMVALAADWGISKTGEPGDASTAWAAVEDCHRSTHDDQELVGADS